MAALEEQRGCDESVIGNIEVQTARQVVGARLEMLKDGRYVTLDAYPTADIASVPHAFQPAVRSLRRFTEQLSSSAPLVVV